MSLIEFLRKNLNTIVLILIGIAILFVNFFVYRFAMDMIIVVLILLAIIFKKQKEFFKEWSIPIILFYLYEFLSG